MRESYRAILKGDRLEWQGDGPITEDKAVNVRVTVIDVRPQEAQQRGARMVSALEQLADSNAFKKLEDPAAWERRVREERELPSRS